MELTNALRKDIKLLADAKHRSRLGLFTAEGTKCVSDTAGAFVCHYLFANHKWLDEHPDIVKRLQSAEVFEASRADFERMSHLTTPTDVMAVYEIPATTSQESLSSTLKDEIVVALDRIQDPGNLGTIIRLCDWMGVTTILASAETADVWAPKVVQATMGAIARVKVIYCNLQAMLDKWPSPVYGTFLDAPDIYTASLGSSGVIVFGNEGHGISSEVATTINRKLFIPSFPPGRQTSESLNVATAAAITLAEFRSRQIRSCK